MVWQTPSDTALRYERFADAIIAGQRPSEAAITAGYPSRGAHKTGSDLSLKPEIIALIDLRRSMLVTRADWTPERVIRELASTAQDARDAGQLAVARQCYRDIGEHIGMWPKQPVSIDARSQILALPDGLSVDELRALASPIYREGVDADDSSDAPIYIDSDSASPSDAVNGALDVTSNPDSTD